MAESNYVFCRLSFEDNLDGDKDYPLWAYMMQHVLVSKGMWNNLQGIEVHASYVDARSIEDVASSSTSAGVVCSTTATAGVHAILPTVEQISCLDEDFRSVSVSGKRQQLLAQDWLLVSLCLWLETTVISSGLDWLVSGLLVSSSVQVGLWFRFFCTGLVLFRTGLVFLYWTGFAVSGIVWFWSSNTGQYDLLAKTKSIDNKKTFIKAKGNKYKYNDMIYNELEFPLRLISQHFRVQNPPRHIEPLLHIAVVMALAVVENRIIRCDHGKFILENLVEANPKGSAKNKLYMSARPMLTRIAYQDLGMIEDLPAANTQASLIQHARSVAKPIKTTTAATSSRTTRSLRKRSSDYEKKHTDKEADSKGSYEEDIQKGAEAKGPSEHEKSDEDDTSTPLDRKSKKPRSEQQILLAEAQAKVS
ncbi:hypothetical protein L7F22_063580 [Adiantum nelumboides]|nr:hypothetical protein [Adiantum nelumboides]